MKAILSLAVLSLCLSAASFGQDVYRERYRPQFHFTPERNWMNDPNGMVHYDGEWHLFYQYNPLGDRWGHMSWGHAVSRDLVHWNHLPVAIPEADKVMIFSGSAVVDWENTSGFGPEGGPPPLVAIYTGHHTDEPRQDQRIAFSNDRGRTWTNYAENPVLDIRKTDFRDPKVFWHGGAGRWVMVVAHPLDRQVGFYGSPDLKHWRPLGEFGPSGSTEGIWECPDLFPLEVEGGGGLEKWVLVVNVGGGGPAGGSGCQYFVGEFDGSTFTPDPQTHPPAPPVPEGDLVADFEDGYGGWTAEGDAFGDGPARGALDGQMALDGFLGDMLVNSFRGGDRSTGTLTSPEFVLTRDAVSFLIGGGSHEGRTCLNLMVGGEVVRTAAGDAAERLRWKSWDVGELRGRTATLQVVDDATEGWGHINIDHVVLTDEPAAAHEVTVLWADWGPDFYAAVSWSDVPADDGRRVWIGWMSNWRYAQDVPTSPWRSAMTVPRTLALRETAGGGFRLLQQPVRELAQIRDETAEFAGGSLEEANAWLTPRAAGLVDAEFSFEGGGDVVLRISGAGDDEIEVSAEGDRLVIDRDRSGEVGFSDRFAGLVVAPLGRDAGGGFRLRILLDTSSIEVFANGGESVATAQVFPEPGPYTLGLAGRDVRVGTARLSRLRPTWPRPGISK